MLLKRLSSIFPEFQSLLSLPFVPDQIISLKIHLLF